MFQKRNTAPQRTRRHSDPATGKFRRDSVTAVPPCCSYVNARCESAGSSSRAFTLIELLIVVAIIAILAAIAVPNFLEAQIRAKVSRVKADLRTVATGLEAYAVSENNYPPNDGVYNVVPVELTTPVAYLTSVRFADPFTDKERADRPGVDPELARFYTYTKVVTFPESLQLSAAGRPCPVEGIDGGIFNPGAAARYGPWRILSHGPDRLYSGQFQSPPNQHPTDRFNPNPGVLWGADIPYDPTNGTVSFGNVLRTQRSVGGIAAYAP